MAARSAAILLAAILGFSMGSVSQAAPDAPKPAPSATPVAPAAGTPAAAPVSVDATDVDTLRKHLNEQVTLHGTPTTTGISKSGTVAYLNFGAGHGGVALVFFLKSGSEGKAGSEDDIKPFVGKAVSVTGKLVDYKGNLQVTVDILSQIVVTPTP